MREMASMLLRDYRAIELAGAAENRDASVLLWQETVIEYRRLQEFGYATQEQVDSDGRILEVRFVSDVRDSSGRIVFLETGDAASGLKHIVSEHAVDFANIGVSETQIANVVVRAVQEGKIVGYQGRGTERPIYQILVNNRPQRIAVTTGSNGYIVGANPAGSKP